MRPASIHILLLLLVLPCLLTGCAQRGRVIPEEKMSRIYEDMLLADQWLRDHPDSRKAADTTLFFDPIFKRYGYRAGPPARTVQERLELFGRLAPLGAGPDPVARPGYRRAGYGRPRQPGPARFARPRGFRAEAGRPPAGQPGAARKQDTD